MGQNLKSKMKLSIILVFLTFALTIDAGPPGLYLKPAGPPGLYLKPIDGRQQLEQTRGGDAQSERNMDSKDELAERTVGFGEQHAAMYGKYGNFADREQVDEESLAMNRKGREYFKKKYGNIPSQKTRADEVDGSALEGKD